MVELCVSVMNISTNDFHWYVNTQQIAWTKYIYIVYIVYPYNRSNVTESPVRLYWPFLVTIYKIEPLLCCLSRENYYRNTIFFFFMISMKYFQYFISGQLEWDTWVCLCCFPRDLIITGTMGELESSVRWDTLIIISHHHMGRLGLTLLIHQPGVTRSLVMLSTLLSNTWTYLLSSIKFSIHCFDYFHWAPLQQLYTNLHSLQNS